MQWQLIAVTATFVAVLVGGVAGLNMALDRRQVNRTLRALPTSQLDAADLDTEHHNDIGRIAELLGDRDLRARMREAKTSKELYTTLCD